jgi:hypothetical protein
MSDDPLAANRLRLNAARLDGAVDLNGNFARNLWSKIAQPICELTAHFIITVFSISFIAGTEWILILYKLGATNVPLLGITLSQWMFDLEIFSATIINGIGIIKAAKAAWST